MNSANSGKSVNVNTNPLRTLGRGITGDGEVADGDEMLNYDPDVLASGPTENSVQALEPTPEPNEEITLTEEQLETFLSEREEHHTSRTECNADSEGLEAIPVGSRILIGYVDEVNGKGAEEVPGVVPNEA